MTRLRATLAASAMTVSAISPTGAFAANMPDAKTSFDCAVWAAVWSGQSEDADMSAAFNTAMTWFFGRYEGISGKRFDQNANAARIEDYAPRMDELNTTCLPLMEDMGNRLGAFGDVASAKSPSARKK